MEYGTSIKEARKALKLKQSDVANSNLSRTILSDIEQDKVKLVPSKALLIYKKLITESHVKGVKILLNFDEVLSNNLEYLNIKTAHAVIGKHFTSKSKHFNTSELEADRIWAIRNDIGILKFFVLDSIRLQSEDNDFKMKVCFNALDFLKWQNFNDVHLYYADCLKNSTHVAFQNGAYIKLLEYYVYLEDNLYDYGIQIDPKLYYNIGLIYKKIENYKLSYKYIERYIDFSRDLSIDDKLDALILLGNISVLRNDNENSMSIYYEVYGTSIENDLGYHQMLVLSCLIYALLQSDSIDLIKLKKYTNELSEIFPLYIDMLLAKYSIYLNISLAYNKISNYTLSEEYILLSLKNSNSDSDKVCILFDYFFICDTINEKLLITSICEINYTSLEYTYREKLMAIILTLFSYDSKSTELSIYISKHIGGRK